MVVLKNPDEAGLGSVGGPYARRETRDFTPVALTFLI
jgi:hypothetical protein